MIDVNSLNEDGDTKITKGTPKTLKVGRYIELGDTVDFGEGTYFWADDNYSYVGNNIQFFSGENKVNSCSYNGLNDYQYVFTFSDAFTDVQTEDEGYDNRF
ncbi:MAG: hypothetical protein K6B74_09550 [Ruminococcus sp.]|nr:hypothetical protein [Ruminococcus sp.]